MKHSLAIIITCLIAITQLHSQDKFTFNGYLSNMGQTAFAKDENSNYKFNSDLILHNRMNLAYYANDNFTFHAQFRNQFIWGKSVELNPGYAESLAKDRGFLNMNFNWWENDNNVMNTQFDRAYVEYVNGNLELSLGRQRVNWGRTLIWNPNDIFNAFSYYDFDYMERPGSDAFRANYYFGTASSAEIVTKIDSANNITIAGLGKFNKWGYDIQFIGGYVDNQDFVIGTGWEGNIKSLAFRGEMNYYHPKENFSDSAGVFLASISFDYLISSSLTAQFEFLYNDSKTIQDISSDPSVIFNAPATSKSLSFSEYNFFTGLMWQINPILTVNAAAMYYTQFNGYFLMPAIDLSLMSNLYLSVMYQYFNFEVNSKRVGSNIAFVRLKWNF